MDILKYENHYRDKGFKTIVGIDEAGRGPLAGPVVAVSLNWGNNDLLEGVKDSKKITEKKRNKLYDLIIEKAEDIGIGIIHEKKIDEINILKSTYLAMRKSIDHLNKKPDIILVDGNKADLNNMKQKNIIKGDSLSYSIACASIIAKVTRDRIMKSYSLVFPEYGFDKHKGYGTKFHLEMIKKFGSTVIHRKSFNPISKFLPTYKSLKNNEDVFILALKLISVQIIHQNYKVIYINNYFDIVYIKESILIIISVTVDFKNETINSKININNSNLRYKINEFLIDHEDLNLKNYMVKKCHYNFNTKNERIKIFEGTINEI